MTDVNTQEIFDAGIEEDLGRDLIIVNLVKGGLSLNAAQNAYKDLAQEAGITTTKVGHKAEAIALLEANTPDIADDTVRAETRADLMEEFGVASSTAGDYIKAYAAKAGIELPKSNFGSNPEEQAKIFAFICENPDVDKADFRTFMIEEMGRSSGSIDETYRGLVMARKLVAAGVEFTEESEAA